MQLFDKTIHSRILLSRHLRLYYISFRLKAGAQGSYVHKVTTPMHYNLSVFFCDISVVLCLFRSWRGPCWSQTIDKVKFKTSPNTLNHILILYISIKYIYLFVSFRLKLAFKAFFIAEKGQHLQKWTSTNRLLLQDMNLYENQQITLKLHHKPVEIDFGEISIACCSLIHVIWKHNSRSKSQDFTCFYS